MQNCRMGIITKIKPVLVMTGILRKLIKVPLGTSRWKTNVWANEWK